MRRGEPGGSCEQARGDEQGTGGATETKGDLEEGRAGCPPEVRLERTGPMAGEVPGLDKRTMTDKTNEQNQVWDAEMIPSDSPPTPLRSVRTEDGPEGVWTSSFT